MPGDENPRIEDSPEGEIESSSKWSRILGESKARSCTQNVINGRKIKEITKVESTILLVGSFWLQSARFLWRFLFFSPPLSGQNPDHRSISLINAAAYTAYIHTARRRFVIMLWCCVCCVYFCGVRKKLPPLSPIRSLSLFSLSFFSLLSRSSLLLILSLSRKKKNTVWKKKNQA